MALRLTAAALACAAPSAHADTVTIDVGRGATIDAAQLYDALRGRITNAGTVRHVRIEAIPRGVAIAVGKRRREVPLDGLTGAEAARLVALAMLDLLDEPSSPDAIDPDHDDDVVAGAAPPVPGIELGLVGGASAWSGVLAMGGVDVIVPAGAHLLGIDVAGGGVVTGGLHFGVGLLRLGAVGRTGILEARGSLVAAPVFVGEANGDTTVLFGFGASVSARVPITGTARFVLTGGADLFATRTEYSVGGMAVASTPWLAPWMALGLEVQP